jgi:shikimate dehydrogenase
MVWNRTAERADQLARDLDVEAVKQPREADLLVNATSVGLDPATSEHDALEHLGLSAVDCRLSAVVDLVYRPDGTRTPIDAWASRAGARVVGGLEVLVRQGARSLALWTGREAPLAVMRKAALGGNPRSAT